MTSKQTLLNLIAQKYTNRREDVAVDALGYILSYSEASRTALTDKLRGANIWVAPISKVITQAVGANGERPDLACYDDEDNECLLIEAKFWAGLTGHQPGGYLERLLVTVRPPCCSWRRRRGWAHCGQISSNGCRTRVSNSTNPTAALTG